MARRRRSKAERGCREFGICDLTRVIDRLARDEISRLSVLPLQLGLPSSNWVDLILVAETERIAELSQARCDAASSGL